MVAMVLGVVVRVLLIIEHFKYIMQVYFSIL